MSDIAYRISTCWPSDTEVVLSGTSSSGAKYDRLFGVVASVGRDDAGNVDSVKIWPDADNIEDGKVWFRVENITAFEIIDPSDESESTNG